VVSWTRYSADIDIRHVQFNLKGYYARPSKFECHDGSLGCREIVRDELEDASWRCCGSANLNGLHFLQSFSLNNEASANIRSEQKPWRPKLGRIVQEPATSSFFGTKVNRRNGKSSWGDGLYVVALSRGKRNDMEPQTLLKEFAQ
jgi:hypothetical protein